MRNPISLAIDWRRPRTIVTFLLIFALISMLSLIRVWTAKADAGNPILGTIRSTTVDNGDGTVTVFVRGQWNWFSHGSDCNENRAATGVGIAWQDLNGPGTNPGASEVQRVTITGSPTGGTFKLKFDGKTTANIPFNATASQVDSALEALESVGTGNVEVTGGPGPGSAWNVAFTGALAKANVLAMTASKSFTGGTNPNIAVSTPTPGVNAVYNGYLVENGPIRAYIGTSSATSPGGHSNPQDRMVHPVDRGNQVEGYNVAGTDYPASQAFVDPSSNNPNDFASWKGGCGRQPLTDTASQGNPFGEATGLPCADGTTACSGKPWGSWGYEKTDGAGHRGYSHTYLKTMLPDQVCVNFYDVHGGGTGADAQKVKEAKEITVDLAGDNSIDTNSFNVNDGANCITVSLPQITVTKNPKVQQVTSGGTATWTIHVENTGNVTLTNVNTTDAQAPGCARTSAAIAADGAAPNPGTATFDPGDTYDYSCSKTNVTSGFSNVVVACGTFAATDDTCDDDPATLDARTGVVIVSSTEQNFVPNDSFNVSGLTSPSGNVTFKLYKGTDCTVAANKILEQTIAVNANGSFGTTNSTDLKTLLATAGLPTATGGTFSWLVTYDDANNAQDITIACGAEKFVVTNA